MTATELSRAVKPSPFVGFVTATLLVESILAGPLGVVIHGIRIRFFLLLLSCGILLAVTLMRGKVSRSHVFPILVIGGFLALQITWATLVPIVQGTDLSHSIKEARSFLVIAMPVLVLTACPATARERLLRRVQKVVAVATLVVVLVRGSLGHLRLDVFRRVGSIP